MTREQATEIGKAVEATGKIGRVEVSQFGSATDAPWRVYLWNVNPRAGNRNLYQITEYAPAMTAAHIRKALGKANARDNEAFARMEAEKAVNRE